MSTLLLHVTGSQQAPVVLCEDAPRIAGAPPPGRVHAAEHSSCFAVTTFSRNVKQHLRREGSYTHNMARWQHSPAGKFPVAGTSVRGYAVIDSASVGSQDVVAEEERRLESLGATELLDTPAEEGFDRITRLARTLFGVSTATVALVADDRQFLKSVAGNLESNIARANAFCSHTILTPETLVVEDAREDDRFSANPLVLGQPNIRFYAGQPLQGPGGWNIGTLCIIDQTPRTFDDEQRQVLRDLAAVVQREINVRTDMRNAARIQRALLPTVPPVLPGYDLQVLLRPAGDLSGDFYDWHTENRGFRFTVADVMGKGTGPAILGAGVQAKLRAAAASPPGRTLTTVSHDLDTGVDLTDVFVTAFHAELDPQTGRVDYSDAGHGLAHHITVDGRVQRLPTAGPPLGIVAGYEWPTQTLTLAPGEALLMPTDGVLELFDEDLHRLAAALAELAERAAGDGLEAAFENLASASSVRTDDVTLLVLRRAR